MNTCGLILSLIAVFFSILIIVIHPLIKKITNLYWFWLIVGIILLVYLMIFRFGPEFKDFIQDPKSDDDIIISRGLLLDLCPFCAIFLPTLMILDPSRKFLRIIAPFAIFGGLITLFGGISIGGQGDEDATWSFKWIFLGTDLNPMYYSMHFINLFFGVWVLLNCDNRKIIRIYIYDIIFIVLYFVYVFVVMKKTGIVSNTTGVSDYDWIYGEYSDVASFFHIDLNADPEKVWLVRTLGYGAATIAIVLTIFFFFAIQKWLKWYKPIETSKFKLVL